VTKPSVDTRTSGPEGECAVVGTLRPRPRTTGARRAGADPHVARRYEIEPRVLGRSVDMNQVATRHCTAGRIGCLPCDVLSTDPVNAALEDLVGTTRTSSAVIRSTFCDRVTTDATGAAGFLSRDVRTNRAVARRIGGFAGAELSTGCNTIWNAVTVAVFISDSATANARCHFVGIQRTQVFVVRRAVIVGVAVFGLAASKVIQIEVKRQ